MSHLRSLRRRIPYRTVLLAGAALLAPALAGAQTLPQAVNQAIQTHPSILAAEADAASAEALIDAARASWFPFLNAEVEGGPEVSNTAATRAEENTTDAAAYAFKPTYNARLTLTQMLFDGFETENRQLAAQLTANAALRLLANQEETIALRSVTAYLETLRQRQRLGLAADNLRAHQRVLALVERRAESGAGPEIDVAQAQSRLAAAEGDYLNEARALRMANAQFVEAVGAPPAALNVPRTPIERLPRDVAEAVNAALVSNPELQAIGVRLRSLRAQADATESPLFPQLSLESTVGNEQSRDGVDGANFDASAFLRLEYALSTGGSDVARSRSATAQVAALANQEAAARRTLGERVRIAYGAIGAQRDRAPALRRAALSAARVVEAYRRQFERGQRTLLDVLDVERELFQVRGALLDAEYAFALANYNALAAIGRLVEAAPNVQSLPDAIMPPHIIAFDGPDGAAGAAPPAPAASGAMPTAVAAAPSAPPARPPSAAAPAPAAPAARAPSVARPQTVSGPDPTAPPPPPPPIGPPITPQMVAAPPLEPTAPPIPAGLPSTRLGDAALSASTALAAAPAGPAYAVQVGVYADPNYANDLARALTDAGYPVAVSDSGSGLVTIRMSGYPSEADAQTAARAFRDQSGLGAIVVREETETL